MPVRAELDTRLRARDLLELRPGDVLSLGHALRHPVEVRVGDVAKFTGRLTRAETHVAVSVEAAVAPPRDPIEDGSAPPAPVPLRVVPPPVEALEGAA